MSIKVVPILPKGVNVTEKDKDIRMVIELADTGSITFSYSADEIKDMNYPDGLYGTYKLDDGNVTATVTGPLVTLKTMSSADVSIGVDGSKFSVGTASGRLTATTQITGVSISLSPQTVSVSIKEK